VRARVCVRVSEGGRLRLLQLTTWRLIYWLPE